MKKFGGYIMLLLILANIFVPLFQAQKAFAAGTGTIEISTSGINSTSATITVKTTWKDIDATKYSNAVTITATDPQNNKKTADFITNLLVVQYPTLTTVSGQINDLKPDTTYTLSAVSKLVNASNQATEASTTTVQNTPTLKTLPAGQSASQLWYYDGRYGISVPYNTKELCTSASGAAGFNAPCFLGDSQIFKDLTAKYEKAKKDGTLIINKSDKEKLMESETTEDIMPACSMSPWDSNGTVMGCVAQGFYYVIFVPTSFLFALGGRLFDFAFKYSIDDSSYRTSFVVEGWKIVRDLCNIFFIFVLLYAAIKLILGVGSHTKDTIVHVIVIGLLINFSLFATQMIVDSSNILARLFYNSDAIKITISKDGGADPKGGTMMYSDSISNTGEIPLSAAIVDKINPQNIIINAKQINVPDPAGIENPNDPNATGYSSKAGIGVGPFILITILASIVNFIGFFIFLSIGLIFVSRVIGLWIAMILAPLAFFSYTVPELAKQKTIGWSNWWSDTFQLAFLAPVFMFFMYLILIFLDNSFLNLTSNASSVNFILATILPFAFIIILLNQAKDLAKSMSGKIGGMITNYATAAGGAVLGGAALGGAMLGRQTLGAVSKYAQNDGARDNALKFKSTQDAVAKIKGWNAINPFAYGKVATTFVKGVGQATAAGVGAGVSTIGRKTDPTTGKTTSWYQRTSAQQKDKDHSIHALDEKAQAIAHSNYADLDEPEKQKVRDAVNRDVISKGMDYNKNYDKLSKPEKLKVDAEIARLGGDLENVAHIKGKPGSHSGKHMEDLTKANTSVSEFVNALRKGSYDVRNMSKMTTQSKGLPGFLVNTTAGIASSMRTNLKDTVGISHGNGNKDFVKDLKEVLTEAFKTAKLEVKIPESHGGGGHDDHGHGGGHDDHGGGGHH